MTLHFSNPFALSLSKGRLGQLCFDKLSTNGIEGHN
jgi:hypothetical protein